MSINLKWDNRFIELAKLIATWSKDPSTQCGAVIVDKDKRVISTGYNGFPAGVVDYQSRYYERETKYKFVAHADLNAIFSAARIGVSLIDTIMYITHPPCHECMKGIIQAGITTVVWPKDNSFENTPEAIARWQDSLSIMSRMAMEAGIKLVRV